MSKEDGNECLCLRIESCYTGKEFNSLCMYAHSLYRITNREEEHNGFKYNTGLNEDTLQFNPTGKCSAGGLYFFDRGQVSECKRYVKCGYWIRKLEIPNDARVYVENNKYKTNKFILHERIRIGNVRPENLCGMYDKCTDFLKNEYGINGINDINGINIKKPTNPTTTRKMNV